MIPMHYLGIRCDYLGCQRLWALASAYEDPLSSNALEKILYLTVTDGGLEMPPRRFSAVP